MPSLKPPTPSAEELSILNADQPLWFNRAAVTEFIRQRRMNSAQFSKEAGFSDRTLRNWLHPSRDDAPLNMPRSRRTIDEIRGVMGCTYLDLLLRSAPRPPAINATPTASVAVRWTNAQPPLQWTTLFGRADDEAALVDRVRSSRQVTVTGPGGVGKTALTVRVARLVADAFHDGVCFVPLDRVLVGHRLAADIGRALGFRAADGDELAERIGASHLLLVLDTADHLLADVRDLANTLLSRCPNLTLVVTSQRRLGAASEHVVPLKPLSRDDAVDHLLARAAAFGARIDLALEDQTAAAAQICERLLGLPLAIELAAARLATISPPLLLEHLHTLFTADGSASAAPCERQGSLYASAAYAGSRLAPAELTALFDLATFAGPWTFDAALAATTEADGPGAPLRDPPFVHTLHRLVDSALVIKLDERRFDVLPHIKAWARQTIPEPSASARIARLRQRQAHHYLSRIVMLDPVRSPRVAAADPVHTETESVEAALLRSADTASTAISMLPDAMKLYEHYWRSGRWGAGAELLSRIARQSVAIGPDISRAIAASGSAMMHALVGQSTIAARDGALALRLVEGRCEQYHQWVLRQLAMAQCACANFTGAQASLQLRRARAAAVAGAVDPERGIPEVRLLRTGTFRPLHPDAGLIEAIENAHDMLGFAEREGDTLWMARERIALGWLLAEAGKARAAEEHLGVALTIAGRDRSRHAALGALEATAAVFAGRGDRGGAAGAARAIGAYRQVVLETGFAASTADGVSTRLMHARSRLDDDAWRRAQAEGARDGWQVVTAQLAEECR